MALHTAAPTTTTTKTAATTIITTKQSLTGKIPEELGELETVVNVYLHENDLSGPLPSKIERMKKLGTCCTTISQQILDLRLWRYCIQLSRLPPSTRTHSPLLFSSSSWLFLFFSFSKRRCACTTTICLVASLPTCAISRPTIA